MSEYEGMSIWGRNVFIFFLQNNEKPICVPAAKNLKNGICFISLLEAVQTNAKIVCSSRFFLNFKMDHNHTTSWF